MAANATALQYQLGTSETYYEGLATSGSRRFNTSLVRLKLPTPSLTPVSHVALQYQLGTSETLLNAKI